MIKNFENYIEVTVNGMNRRKDKDVIWSGYLPIKYKFLVEEFIHQLHQVYVNEKGSYKK